MSNLPQPIPISPPTTMPAEMLNISPEALEIANCYLQTPDISEVSESLGVARDIISQTLNRREVKAYIDQVFYNLGFNNRFKLRDLMDTLIKKKLREMDEADIGTTKDITELIALSHKMTMEQMDKELALEKIRAASVVRTQTNIQVNNEGITGTKYGDLINNLLNPKNDGTIDI